MDDQSFKDNVSFWIKNLQLKVPDSVVLLVGTHVDQCKDETEVNEKKKHINERVKAMLEMHTTNLELRRKNLEDDPSLNCEQINQIERLAEYKLKVIWFCIAHSIKCASNKMCCHDLLNFLLFSGP